jgi:hypothetical protein
LAKAGRVQRVLEDTEARAAVSDAELVKVEVAAQDEVQVVVEDVVGLQPHY